VYAHNILAFVNGGWWEVGSRTDKSYSRRREPTGKPGRIVGAKAEAKLCVVSR
jgi:hypothetical protein